MAWMSIIVKPLVLSSSHDQTRMVLTVALAYWLDTTKIGYC